MNNNLNLLDFTGQTVMPNAELVDLLHTIMPGVESGAIQGMAIVAQWRGGNATAQWVSSPVRTADDRIMLGELNMLAADMALNLLKSATPHSFAAGLVHGDD